MRFAMVMMIFVIGFMAMFGNAEAIQVFVYKAIFGVGFIIMLFAFITGMINSFKG